MREHDKMSLQTIMDKGFTRLRSDIQHTKYKSSNLVVDKLATCLIPCDLGEGFTAIRTTGNGNCLYNAVSIALIGKYIMYSRYL